MLVHLDPRTLSLHTDRHLVRTLPAVLGYGAGFAILLGAFDYTGGVLTGYDKDPNVDEYERKEALRKNRRRPIQETLEQLGEGRGMLIHHYRTLPFLSFVDSILRHLWSWI